jgi:hypothetical protein
MSFCNIKLKKLAKNVSLPENKVIELLLRQAKYLKIDSNLLLKSYVVLDELKIEATKEEAKKLKEKSRYKTKNLIISKYMDVIIKLYKDGKGAINIAKYLKLHHKVTLSRSAIDNFIKVNGIRRDG